MEKTISQLSEIEEKAIQIINRANEEKISLYDEYEKNAAHMEADLAADTANKLNILREQADAELANEMKILITNSEKHMGDLDGLDLKQHETLVHQVFDHIIRP